MADDTVPAAVGAQLQQLREEIAAMRNGARRTAVWDAIKVVLPVFLGVASWLLAMEGRVANVEATGSKALDVERLAGSLRAEIAVMHNGPEWLRRDLQKLSDKVDGVRDSVAKVSERVAALEK